MSQAALAKFVKDLRESRGFSQQDVAQQKVCSQSIISKIEQGVTKPSVQTLYYLARQYGVAMNDFRNAMEINENHYEVSTLLLVQQSRRNIRHATRRLEYSSLHPLIAAVEDRPPFQTPYESQFILWHKGIFEHEVKQNHDKAVYYFTKSLDKLPRSLFCQQQIAIHNSRGVVYLHLGQYSKAIDIFLEAVRMIDSCFTPRHQTIIRLYYNLSLAYHKLEQYEQSSFYCQQAMNQCHIHESSYLLSELHYQHGLNQYNLQSLDESRKHISKAIIHLWIQNKRNGFTHIFCQRGRN
jgi:transcriptional regulator with XRE-family HTH domain